MARVSRSSHRVQFEVDRLDGGINTSDAPSRIDPRESPDCLNVIFDDRGAVETRQGTRYLNTSVAEIGTNVFDGLANYNETMVAWAGGDMFRLSGTTFVTIPSAQSQFATGVAVAYEVFQSMLICSDGQNGPFRYEGGSDFYKLGIDQPSATANPTSDTSGGGRIAADTYYYAVSFVNSAIIEGEVGSASAGVTLGASASVDITGIPTGGNLQGVARRNVYRATSATGPWLLVREITDNITTSISDNVAVGSELGTSVVDATAPTPFTTVKQHRERLFFDDSSNRTLVRWTEFSNPYVSKALNFEPISEGDFSNITAIGVQNSLVSVFKGNSIWVINLVDPADDTSFTFLKSPAKGGIVGPRALEEWQDGIVYVAKLNGKIVGFQYLSGVDVENTTNNLLSTENISERIEKDILTWPSGVWPDIALKAYKNRIYCAVPENASSTRNDALYWFDLTRIGNGQPGSWAPWNGVVGVNDFAVVNGNLYGGSSSDDGHVLLFNNGSYTDAGGAAINSYWWSKQLGGEPSIESWIKDFRFVNVWHALLGSYDMNVKLRIDGDSGVGSVFALDLTPGGDLWDFGAWDAAEWGPGQTEDEQLLSFSSNKVGRRAQVGFDNQNIAGQGFKVYSFKVLMNMRRQR